VLVTLDFPSHKEQDAALKQANQGMRKRFGVNSFPTFVLLNPPAGNSDVRPVI